MPYTAEISRKNPSCFIFLIDQSGSMEDGWSGERSRKKSDELATIINRLLQNLVLSARNLKVSVIIFMLELLITGKMSALLSVGNLLVKNCLLSVRLQIIR